MTDRKKSTAPEGQRLPRRLPRPGGEVRASPSPPTTRSRSEAAPQQFGEALDDLDHEDNVILKGPRRSPGPAHPIHGTAFVVAETPAAAYFLRGIAAHVLAIAEVLPLPSQEVQELMRTSGSEQLFAEHPEFDTYTDLQLLAREEIPDLADRLELAADKCDGEAGPDGV